MTSALERLRALAPGLEWDRLPSGAVERFEAFTRASPLYARVLERHPEWLLWLEEPENRNAFHGFHALMRNWQAMRAERDNPRRDASAYPGLLRLFRRRMSIRIAYRDIAGDAPCAEIVEELTRLAEFCLRECLFIAQELWTRRLGAPWDEAIGAPARFCVLGFGKFGGEELNFSSDIDLIYLYEGEGNTRQDGSPTSCTNAEYFHRIGETISQLLNARDGSGFLFRADLRLRPGGATGPLVPNVEAIENYYAAAGQTWERLALIKARPVAGDFGLGSELLESLQSFRYPRHPPPSLAAEVAAMKARTEREVVGSQALERNVKSGIGGIREIEFFAQAMQLLHAGRIPFLQTNSTIVALDQLARYDFLDPPTAEFLAETYWWLRRVEHRLQMAEEQQVHELPADRRDREAIALGLGCASLDAFDRDLTSRRTRVRGVYGTLFHDSELTTHDQFEQWWAFFASGRRQPLVRESLQRWFPGEDASAERLRRFVHDSDSRPLTRTQVRHFTDLIPQLDEVSTRLARPADTLARISTFADRYATRSQFLSACALNRDFLRVLALLFDRSRFIHELLCLHPEIFDEVLRPEILHKRKDMSARLGELGAHSGEPPESFRAWLWLYVRAEQVRAAIAHLLDLADSRRTGRELGALADSVVVDALRRIPGGSDLLVIALGRLGGGEMAFGSDLDLLLVAPEEATQEASQTFRALQKLLGGGDRSGPIYRLDLRLRPHGDAGPIVAGIETAAKYYRTQAHLWEKQVLTRARVLRGPPHLVQRWGEIIDDVLRSHPLDEADARALWHMRLRVQRERDRVDPPERAFKTGPGGLVEIEFALQILQLANVQRLPRILTPNTHEGWTRLAECNVVDQATAEAMRRNLGHLKQIEFALRRDSNRPDTVIPAEHEQQAALARWLGSARLETFWHEHCGRMRETRALATRALRAVLPSTTLE